MEMASGTSTKYKTVHSRAGYRGEELINSLILLGDMDINSHGYEYILVAVHDHCHSYRVDGEYLP